MADRVSSLAKDLEPYIADIVRRMGAGGAGGAGLKTYPIAVHALNDTGIHTGSLDVAQFPQGLLVDGSRALTGNLSVAGGVLIDGVDIDVHAANPDAHHKRATSANAEIGVDANQVLTLGPHDILARHTAVGGAALDVIGLSAPGALARLTPASDVGTTPAAALLRSTNQGGLTLAALTAKGNIDIVNGGDLTVGANILFVDASLESVGINRAPDPQFDLDIAGNLRAVYIVGKHAIQIKDAVMICHYDGREPFETNFDGEPHGHFGQVGTRVGGAIFRPGKFFKGLQAARQVTNLVTNPSFEVGTAGWSLQNYSGDTSTLARSALASYVGGYSLRIGKPVLTGGCYAQTTVTVTAGQTYTVSAWVQIVSETGAIRLFSVDGGVPTWRAETSATGEWVRLSATVTAGSASLGIRIDTGAVGVYYVDAVQIEAGGLSPYLDGSMGQGHSWGGTAHASSSTRTAGHLTYGTAGFPVRRGTVMAWMWLDALETNSMGLFGCNGNQFQAYVNTSANVVFSVGASSLTSSGGYATAGAWHHVALVWNSVTGVRKIYIDGAERGSDSAFVYPTYSGALVVGALSNTGNRWNGYIDDLAIISRALSADEIRTIYESDAPVFAESSVFHFRTTPKGLVWADEEGLWARDAAGNPVLGVYGDSEPDGTPRSKSWGGQTLWTGDILMGARGVTNGGWLLFDQDGPSGWAGLYWGYGDTTVFRLDASGAYFDNFVHAGDGAARIGEDGFTTFPAAIMSAPPETPGSPSFYDYTRAYKINHAGTGRSLLAMNVTSYDESNFWRATLAGLTHDSSYGMSLDLSVSRWGQAFNLDLYQPLLRLYTPSSGGATEARLQANTLQLLGRNTAYLQSGSVPYSRVIASGSDIELLAAEGAVAVNAARFGEAWTTVSYTAAGGTTWTYYTAGQTAQYKKIGDLVMIRGLVKRTAGTGQTIFTLPSGYRPGRAVGFSVVSNGVSAFVRIQTDGQVIHAAGGDASQYVYLDGIVFSTIA